MKSRKKHKAVNIIITITAIIFTISVSADFEKVNTAKISFFGTVNAGEFEEVYSEEDNNISVSSDAEEKIAYLTFDDGPSENTKTVLEVLSKYNIRATFFLIAGNINENTKEYIDEMLKAGHMIGIHTYSHDYNKIYASKESYYTDFYKAVQTVYEYTGLTPKIYRFPGGSTNRYAKSITGDIMDTLENEGFVCYDWNVSAEDSVGTPTESSIMKNIKKDVFKFNTPVILMHDSSINALSAKLLPQIIEMLIEDGYSFDTLDNREQVTFRHR